MIPLSSPQDAADKQDRLRQHRENMASLRQRRRIQIAKLGAQMADLQDNLSNVLIKFDESRASSSEWKRRVSPFVALVREQEALQNEQYALEESLRGRQKHARLVRAERARQENTSRMKKTHRKAHTPLKVCNQTEERHDVVREEPTIVGKDTLKGI